FGAERDQRRASESSSTVGYRPHHALSQNKRIRNRLKIALDATYSVGDALSGVGVYSREILYGLAAAHPEERFLWWYRPHRFLRSYRGSLPTNVRRGLLLSNGLFHGLNQRLPKRRLRYTVTTFHDLFVMTGEYSTSEFRQRFTQQAKDAAARSDRIITVS